MKSINKSSTIGASGIYKEDPSKKIKKGESIEFKGALCTHKGKHKGENHLVRNDKWDSFGGIIVSIYFSEEDAHILMGSAVIVAPGIAICAKHVFADSLSKLTNGKMGCLAICFRDEKLQLWDINGVGLVENSDLIMLNLSLASDLPEDRVFYKSILTTRFPEIGEELTVVGFKCSENEFRKKSTVQPGISGTLLMSTGYITERYMNGRDRAMLPWPCLELDCATLGGMSGGPVFDSKGFLIGVLCSSFDNEGPSYVSLLWPALIQKFKGGWPYEMLKGDKSLIEIGDEWCDTDNGSIKISMKNDVDGNQFIYYEMSN